jgi:hypothetical protein
MPHLPATPCPAHAKADPIQVHLLGGEVIVQAANALAHLIQQTAGLQRRLPFGCIAILR